MADHMKREKNWSKRCIYCFKNHYFIFIKKLINSNLSLTKVFSLGINTSPGDYSEEVIPDPIPNSEVKLFSADGTLS